MKAFLVKPAMVESVTILDEEIARALKGELNVSVWPDGDEATIEVQLGHHMIGKLALSKQIKHDVEEDTFGDDGQTWVRVLESLLEIAKGRQ